MSTVVTGAFLAGVVAGYGVAIPVGAIAVLILGLAARTSFRVGASAALGVATADGIYAGVAAFGGAVVAGWLAPFATPLRLVAAAVLLGLAGYGAWRALRPRGSADPAAGVGRAARRGLDTPIRAFAGILALTLLNPATVVYFTALVLGRVELGGSGFALATLFTLGVFLASASWQLLIAAGGTMVGRVLTGVRGRLVTALSSSAIIAALAVAMLLNGH
ncbi:LysE/ArgO family amino acid transporter [Micromonospora maris]|uniref:Lysine transporter LysE n=1 Tax=Micromonospora maris TaxID=1003110 RepID=A0A9X0I2F2_9ACTN|nr:LysE family transporter [Micromonospora maris]AEB46279.1 lysine exporter protein [Micromonospora maris AB-18-032]KUJ45525.1 lysine transporter LysE [Micromonospora maris]